MIVDVIMPKMGESVNEGTILKWHKKVGDKVKLDETMLEIATDKVDTEVPAPAEGVVVEIIVNEQETVEVGTVIAKIATEGEAAPEKTTTEKKETVTEKTDKEEKQTVKPVEKTAVSRDEASSFFSPLVLNIASVENISMDELKSIGGTGIGGRVTKKDVLNYLEERKNKPANKTELSAVAEKTMPVDFQNGEEVIPMENVRRKIMEHMVRSRDTSVHVTAVVEVDMSKIEKDIKLKKEEFLKAEGVKLTYMSYIALAAIKALKEYPLVNSSIDGTNIIKKKNVNLGIAVSVEPNGLMVPNIKSADEKNLTGLAKAIAGIADKARSKKLSPDDIVGGTFTITNYGVFGSLFGTPIINQPEVAILGVGAVVKRPVVIEADDIDTIAIKPMMYLTLSHDHRLVDGMLGGKFLKSIKDSLEKFLL